MLNNLILIADDDKNIADLMKSYFQKENFNVLTAYDGIEAVDLIKKNKPDIILLDLMMPGMNGYDVLKEARKISNVPILMLTAKDEETDTLEGFEVGADAYITKPFSPREVVARVKAVLRRVKTKQSKLKNIVIADIVIDISSHTVSKNKKALDLTAVEFKILEFLSENLGHAYSRLEIIEKVKGCEFEGYERNIDVHIKNIRKKIEDDPQDPKFIITLFGIGYKMVDPSN